MSFIVTIITTKPSSSTFYSNVSQSNLDETTAFQNWTASLPGFIQYTTETPDENTAIQIYEWVSESDYTNWWDTRWDHEVHQERMDYNAANGIVSDITTHTK